MKTLEINDIRKMLFGGTKLLELNKDYVDSLNVFPVPDGDTGTNMTMTITSAYNASLACEKEEIDAIMSAFAKGALSGARGNSGVILSQVLKGIADEFKDEKGVVTSKVLSKAFIRATKIAYSAVTKPKEGTILTVIRYIGEQSISLAIKYSDIVQFLKECVAKGKEILDKTPDLLPVLKQAGVVDSGGQGLLYVIEGFYKGLADLEIGAYKYEEEQPELSKTQINFLSFADYENNDAIINSDQEIEFGYCTEYFVTNLKPTITEEDINKLRDKLLKIGDCVICIGDLDLIKVHVHTNEPNKALKYALDIGELDKTKIENMRQQNRIIKEKRKKEQEENNKKVNSEYKEIGLIAIAAGSGMINMFKELQVDQIIEGGQTMNPSVDDINSMVNKINSNKIIILPNNKNIILAAERVKDIINKEIFIVPTINMIQGIRAALLFDRESTIEENIENMNEAISEVKFGQVTHSVRTVSIDGFDLNEGDFIGLNDKNILTKGNDLNTVTLDLIDKIKTPSDEVLSLYVGFDVKEEKEELIKLIKDKYDDLELEVYEGLQPHYYYMFGLE